MQPSSLASDRSASRKRARRAKALDWIADTTGIALTDTEYKLYLGLFRGLVERRLA